MNTKLFVTLFLIILLCSCSKKNLGDEYLFYGIPENSTFEEVNSSLKQRGLYTEELEPNHEWHSATWYGNINYAGVAFQKVVCTFTDGKLSGIEVIRDKPFSDQEFYSLSRYPEKLKLPELKENNPRLWNTNNGIYSFSIIYATSVDTGYDVFCVKHFRINHN